MNKKGIFNGIILTILLSSLIFLVGYSKAKNNETQKLYQVYLAGEKIGVIEDEQALYDLIDKEQKELKEKYNVDKIYPPSDLKISSVYTYSKNVNSVNEIYEYIKDKDPFTIEGYQVTIKNEKPVSFYLLNEKDLDVAIRNNVEIFVDKDNLDSYLNGTQEKILDTGTTIDKLYLNQEISIKKTYISTEEYIFTNVEDLSKFLLFGTLETQATYIVRLGDTIEDVAFNNKMSAEEFLIINPQIISADALLYPGQIVNIGLINPLLKVMVESTLVENQVIKYETTIEYDSSMIVGKKYIKQEGVNGLSKATFKLELTNGQITATVPIKNEQISAPIDQIVVMGGYKLVYVGDSTYWAWPTNKPYIITSRFGWRNVFGENDFHEGLDISGTGYRSPIYSIQNGVVLKTGYSSSMGNYIYINHNNGYYSVYMHFSKLLVSKGDTVIKGQTIGLMGNTGRSTGTHLHLGISINGAPYSSTGKFIDPLLLYK